MATLMRSGTCIPAIPAPLRTCLRFVLSEELGGPLGSFESDTDAGLLRTCQLDLASGLQGLGLADVGGRRPTARLV